MYYLYYNMYYFIYIFLFIVTIESVGTLPSSVLFIEAVKILKGKCKTFLEELENIGK